jgi:hypothetical protein
MIFAENLFSDLDGPTKGRLGLIILPAKPDAIRWLARQACAAFAGAPRSAATWWR